MYKIITRSRILLLAGAAAGVTAGAVASCGGGAAKGSSKPHTSALPLGAVPADSDRFPHDLHTGDDERIRGYKARGLACTDCHPREAVLKGQYARPGLNQHAPCDDCHKNEFYKPPGKFCRNCHTVVDAKNQGNTDLQRYPERGFRRVLAARFSHRLHLDESRMESEVGFHVDCADCHNRDGKSRDPRLPGHKQCARCHAEKSAARDKLDMGDCQSCHPRRDIDLVRGRIFITGDLIFTHASHEADAEGKQISCEVCHSDIPASRSAADASVPAMQRCAVCHEDAAKSPDRVRIGRCEVCHKTITSGVAPMNHLVRRGLPEDHTLEFRRNHGEQAADPNANCAFCHDGLGKSNRDSCFQCHNVMKPRDHNLGWRDDSHGREAAAERDRCTVCHTADYCTACHSVPPRSHQPYVEFRLGGHAEVARFDLRSCFACHTFESTCSDCHRGLR
ncbi:MAG: hypothetical protein MJE77_03075 [Proteobacteria bacterium]|nr:hypothetical protein [Pseudomonadota bacterium]